MIILLIVLPVIVSAVVLFLVTRLGSFERATPLNALIAVVAVAIINIFTPFGLLYFFAALAPIPGLDSRFVYETFSIAFSVLILSVVMKLVYRESWSRILWRALIFVLAMKVILALLTRLLESVLW